METTAQPGIEGRATVGFEDAAGGARVVLSGTFSMDTTPGAWEQATSPLEKSTAKSLEIDATAVTYLDGFGAGLLIDIQRRAIRRGMAVTLTGLKPDMQAMVAPFDPASYAAMAPVGKPEPAPIESVGVAVSGLIKDLLDFAEFSGELAKALAYAALHPSTIRWKDVHRTAVVAGADALPVVMLVGFLIGFVMAFQSAIPMRQFGADVFLPSLVGLAMVRELGPIMTALGLAGRSGAAFAAEIGTMKVNEEVSALVTMGLAPVRFLIVPRVLAAVAMTPFLIVFANIAGLLGGFVVFVTLGYPMGVYFDQLEQYVGLSDLLGGLFKGFAFGFVVAGVGCMRGLQTATGASAVGKSTTSAVVTSIVLVAIGDGLFAILYYALGI